MVEKTNPSESAAAAEKCEMSNNQVSGITEIPGCCRADITRAHFPPAEDKCVKVQKRGGVALQHWFIFLISCYLDHHAKNVTWQ